MFGSRKIPFFIFTMFLLAGGLTAQSLPDNEVLLSRAEAAFREGNELLYTNPASAEEAYRSAVNYYNSIVGSGTVNAGLYYNIGNIYVRLEEYGRAILNYRKALLYSPNDPQIRYNLDYARSLQKNGFPPDAENEILSILFFWHNAPRLWRLAALIVANLVFWSVLILMRFGRAAGKIAIVPAAVLLLAGCSLLIDLQNDKKLHGVVTAESTIGRLGDSRSYEPAFDAPLYQGLEFSIEQRRVGWILAELPNGELVWIEEADCGIIETQPAVKR